MMKGCKSNCVTACADSNNDARAVSHAWLFSMPRTISMIGDKHLTKDGAPELDRKIIIIYLASKSAKLANVSLQ